MLCACVHACGGDGARTKKSFVAVIAEPPAYPAIRPIATPPLGPICSRQEQLQQLQQSQSQQEQEQTSFASLCG